ncbi:uncharacterized protein LOC109861246 [Pseudomyrmex gracilis]|uniref:uncharacterized protein LOC109861246 n=1 Tax=Pseudomyrmex gracilis TaxID=219809 RepID=UPI0009953476|nr:uncharacterized protein LOC109861246 [Pseudomyrmex gracilis]
MVCNTAMPRTRGPPNRRSVYWWTGEITDFRTACAKSRDQYTHALRHKDVTAVAKATAAYKGYRQARKALRTAISQAKSRAWKKLLETLDANAPIQACYGNEWPSPEPESDPVEWSDELEEKLRWAVRRMTQKSTAPGSDGVPGRVLDLAFGQGPLEACFKHILTDCLRTGWFPPEWKQAKLILLWKKGRPADSPSAYRLISLLDEAGKLLKRVPHGRVGQAGEVALAVSLDISNAFNFFPWDSIGRTLEHHGVLPYLSRILGDYFRDRGIGYTDRFPCGAKTICYADDTLVVVTGDNWRWTRILAQESTRYVVGRIERLGLKVAIY